MLERLPVPDLSEAGIAVMHQLSVSGERPVVLLRAFQSGTIPSGDLPELIAFAWTRDDSPTSGVTEAAWIEIFESAGFFAYPPVSTGRPGSPLTLYRGSTADRVTRMSWTADRDTAVQLGTRHARYGRAWLYEATVRPDAVLAYLERRGEGWTVVINRPRCPRSSAGKNYFPSDRGRESSLPESITTEPRCRTHPLSGSYGKSRKLSIVTRCEPILRTR
jgi:hypothetical protein